MSPLTGRDACGINVSWRAGEGTPSSVPSPYSSPTPLAASAPSLFFQGRLENASRSCWEQLRIEGEHQDGHLVALSMSHASPKPWRSAGWDKGTHTWDENHSRLGRAIPS